LIATRGSKHNRWTGFRIAVLATRAARGHTILLLQSTHLLTPLSSHRAMSLASSKRFCSDKSSAANSYGRAQPGKKSLRMYHSLAIRADNCGRQANRVYTKRNA